MSRLFGTGGDELGTGCMYMNPWHARLAPCTEDEAFRKGSSLAC